MNTKEINKDKIAKRVDELFGKDGVRNKKGESIVYCPQKVGLIK